MRLTKTCRKDGCKRNAWAKGLCRAHYTEKFQLEKNVRGSCIKYAEKNGWLAFHMTPLNWVGLPDCLFIKRGGAAVLFVEFKRPTVTKARLKQDHAIQKLIDFGIPAVVCNNYADFCELLNRI